MIADPWPESFDCGSVRWSSGCVLVRLGRWGIAFANAPGRWAGLGHRAGHRELLQLRPCSHQARVPTTKYYATSFSPPRFDANHESSNSDTISLSDQSRQVPRSRLGPRSANATGRFSVGLILRNLIGNRPIRLRTSVTSTGASCQPTYGPNETCRIRTEFSNTGLPVRMPMRGGGGGQRHRTPEPCAWPESQ